MINWLEIKQAIYDNVYVPSLYEEVLGFFHVKKRFHSPFRDDKHPDCAFYKNKNGEWLWHDFATRETFDIFTTYQRIYNLSFYEVVCQIAERQNLVEPLKNLGLTFKSYQASNRTLINKRLQDSNNLDILNQYRNLIKQKAIHEEVKSEEYSAVYSDWESHHLSYWNLRGIGPNYLLKSPITVIPAEKILLGDKSVYDDTERSPIFCFLDKQKQKILQVYRPYGDKKNKFRSQTNEPFYLANSQKSPLILSKGYKDAILLHKASFNVFGHTGEGKSFNDDFIKTLDKKKPIFILFDNDAIGIKAGIKVKESLTQQGLKAYIINLPPYIGDRKIKDFDDCIVAFGEKASKKLLKRLIKILKNEC